MKRFVFYTSIFLFMSMMVVSYAHAYTFYRNLKMGDKGADVTELQKILNSSPDTQVSVVGSGSPGQETDYFGLLTHQAVIRYQNKYASEILFPVGAMSGSGFVGPFTLKKLNSSGSSSLSPLPPQTISLADPLEKYKVTKTERIDIYQIDKNKASLQGEITNRINKAITSRVDPRIEEVIASYNANLQKVFITRLSNNLVKPGTTLTITGSGFDARNTVYLGPEYVIRSISSMGSTLSFTVPSLPYGKYDVVVKNSKGVSNSMALIIAPYTVSPVTITSVNPQKVKYGGTVTVSGTGFTKNNDIITRVGKIKGISSSDGKTLKFTFTPESFKEIVKMGSQSQSIPMEFYIINESGFSQSSRFIFTY